MVARAGLTLNPGQMADLVLSWRQLAELVAAIPRDRPLADDQASVFHLPAVPPKGALKPTPARRLADAIRRKTRKPLSRKARR